MGLTHGLPRFRAYIIGMRAQSLIIGAGIGLVAIVTLAYLMYMVGLILVLRKLGRLSWLAFVPIANYYAQLRAVNAPRRWFAFALVPYIGAVYAGSAAIRLGRAFNRGPAFSLFWLTFGAPVGMFLIAHSKEPIHPELLEEEATLIDVKAIKRRARDHQAFVKPKN